MVIVFLFLLLPVSARAGYWEARHGLVPQAASDSFWPLSASEAQFHALEIQGAWGKADSQSASARSKEMPLDWRSSSSPAQFLFLKTQIPFTSAFIYGSQTSLNWNYRAHRALYSKGAVSGWKHYEVSQELKRVEGGAGWKFGEVLEAAMSLKSYSGFTGRSVCGSLNWRAFQHWKFSTAYDSSASTAFPESWTMGLTRLHSRGFISAEMIWRRFSRLNPGLFQDTLGFKFGFKAPLASALSLYMGSQLKSHPVDRRLEEPAFSLGLGWMAFKNVEIKSGAFLSLRDYFGDGVFWPTDQRTVELQSGFLTMIAWKI